MERSSTTHHELDELAGVLLGKVRDVETAIDRVLRDVAALSNAVGGESSADRSGATDEGCSS